MVLNGLSVTFIPTTVFRHTRKGKPFDNLDIDNMQTRNYALYILCLREYLARKDRH